MSISYVDPASVPPPVGQYSNVACIAPASTVAYVAGQLPVDGDGRVRFEGDFARQAALVFDNLAAALAGVGSSLARVAFIRAFMVDAEDFATFRDVREQAFADHGVQSPPPATTVVVSGLYGGSRVELDAVAVVDAHA